MERGEGTSEGSALTNAVRYSPCHRDDWSRNLYTYGMFVGRQYHSEILETPNIALQVGDGRIVTSEGRIRAAVSTISFITDGGLSRSRCGLYDIQTNLMENTSAMPLSDRRHARPPQPQTSNYDLILSVPGPASPSPHVK